MIPRSGQKFANLDKPHGSCKDEVWRDLKLVDNNRLRFVDSGVTERVVHSQRGAASRVGSSVVIEKGVDSSIIDGRPSISKQHGLLRKNEKESKTKEENGPKTALTAVAMLAGKSFYPFQYSVRRSKKRDTFYTHIASILNEFGPLPVSLIYERLRERIGTQLNPNWKNSVRHALSSKTSFFVKCNRARNSTCRGREWSLATDYNKLMSMKPRVMTRGNKAVGVTDVAKMDRAKRYHSEIMKFYGYYFLDNVSSTARVVTRADLNMETSNSHK